MLNRDECLRAIDTAFTVLWSESHLDYTIDAFAFNEAGIERSWRWGSQLQAEIVEFLSERYPELDERHCRILADLRMAPIIERLQAREGEIRLYLTLVGVEPRNVSA